MKNKQKEAWVGPFKKHFNLLNFKVPTILESQVVWDQSFPTYDLTILCIDLLKGWLLGNILGDRSNEKKQAKARSKNCQESTIVSEKSLPMKIQI